MDPNNSLLLGCNPYTTNLDQLKKEARGIKAQKINVS